MWSPYCWARSSTKRVAEYFGVMDTVRSYVHTCCDLSRGFLVELSKPLLMTVSRLWRGPAKRSLWAGSPIINMAICARGEQLLGVQADSLVFSTYFVTDDFTFNLARWNRGPLVWKEVILPFLVLMWACVRYDRFHFFCDRGLLPTRDFCFNNDELRLLRCLRKEIYLYTYGADVRTRRRTEALGIYNCCSECPSPGRACVCDDARGERTYRHLSANATAIFSMGDMIHYTPGSRNDLFYWPIDLERDGGKRYAPCYPEVDSDRPIRIVHAPNHRGFKGTHFLVEAVERLRHDGLQVELVLVERIPNRLALEIYRSADIIFDQCLVGFHGYFALEALAIGKPVMVFLRDPKTYLLKPEECPFVNTSVESLESDLRMLTQNRSLLRELGKQGRRYIENHYSLAAFAARLKRVYEEIAAKSLSGPVLHDGRHCRQPR
jgi:hypothetical protein